MRLPLIIITALPSLALATFVQLDPPIPIYQPILQGQQVDYKPFIYTPNVLIDRSCVAPNGPPNPANGSFFPASGWQPYSFTIS